MGEVYKPEGAVRGRRIDLPDIRPGLDVKQPSPPEIEALTREVEQIKTELERVKRALKAQGIKTE